MPRRNINEAALEDIIVQHLVDNNGYRLGTNEDYNKEYAIDNKLFWEFLQTTQSDKLEQLHLDARPLEKTKFLNKLNNDLKRHGIIELLRNGFRHLHLTFQLYFPLPSELNKEAVKLYDSNIFSVTRQLRYSSVESNLAIDFVIFLNGLPIITTELKNTYTGQDVNDAVYQYRSDRSPKELLFNFKRSLVHFAADNHQVKMCTHLTGPSSWFLPFNKGTETGGAGNPQNPDGIMTDYLWKEILTKRELSNIIQNYVQYLKVDDKQIFPRYHQLDVVKELLQHTYENDTGNRYLIQHSAGSGKSNSIAWLAHQLVALERNNSAIFDSVVVVTDRVNLDKQIRDTIRQFMQEASTVGWADDSASLKELLDSGKKIIITTVHKFKHILGEIGSKNKDKKFAIIIDEAHSSQSGSLSAQMNIVLSGNDLEKENLQLEDKINSIIEGRKMLKNANYYAFTATPKNKTLEIFGDPVLNPDGTVSHKAFHNYTMRQAIEEGFIMDVLRYYTTIESQYRLAQAIQDDPKFDEKKSIKKLRSYVESNRYTIDRKSGIIVEHFHSQLISKGKIGGKARAMVITKSILRAIDYYYAITKLLEERRSPYKAILAFSGEKEYKGQKLTEAAVNGFPSSKIEEKFKEEPYRLLIVADKFQTGFDEPLLHTMYVDKTLSDIAAVQTLSRLNRAHPLKRDTAVLDFANDTDTIKDAFQNYYKATILSEETDPNKLNELITTLEKHQVYTNDDIDFIVGHFLGYSARTKFEPRINQCAENYKKLESDDQIEFKAAVKGFIRTYNFLAAILPYGSDEWEKLSIFLTLLVKELPSPKTDDLSQGILEAVDYDSYKNIINEEQSISLADNDANINPVPVGGGASAPEPDMQELSKIIESFNEQFGNIKWTHEDKVKKQIFDLPNEVAKNETYQNAARNSDAAAARIESDKALRDVIIASMSSGLELFREYQNSEDFRTWLHEFVFKSSYPNVR